MRTKSRRMTCCGVLSAALMLGAFQGIQTANAAAFLWISAPAWSYSAAAAASPSGSVYFWGLSVGAGTYSWAAAFSTSPFGSAAAFAEAATGLGGVGAAQAVNVADPYAGVGIDTSLIDPSNPSGYPSSEPGSDPLSTPYTVSDTGITFTGSGEELNGSDEVEAFLYTGGTDETTLDTDLGAPMTEMSGSTSGGDVTDVSSLETDFGLMPLDAAVTDPGSLASLTFTENDSSVNTADVILVAEGEAESVPEPMPAFLLAVGALGFTARRRRGMTA